MSERRLEPIADDTWLPEPQPAPRRSAASFAGLWVGILMLLAGGVFGLVYVTAQEVGSPEEAAERLFQAIADEDVLGVVEAFAPSERDAVADNLPDIADELKRLEILSGDFDLRDVAGIDLSFSDLTFTSEGVAEELSVVRIAGGKASYRVDPRQLPLGPFLKRLLGDELEAEPSSGTEDVLAPEEADDSGSEDFVAAIKEDGRWYLSLAYTGAEVARREAGAAVPDFGKGIDPAGAESPEGAVETLVRAGLALDVRRAIALVDPEEGRALHDYAPLFIDEAIQAAGEADFRGNLRSIELSSERAGSGQARVSIKRFEIDVRIGGENTTVAFDGKCATIAGPSVPPGEGRLCPDVVNSGIPPPLADLSTRLPQSGIVVVERDGEWYVAPVRTLMDGVVGVLKAIDGEDLNELEEFFGGTDDPAA